MPLDTVPKTRFCYYMYQKQLLNFQINTEKKQEQKTKFSRHGTIRKT